MSESRYTWLLDAGHGGITDGKYTTDPDFDGSKAGAGTKCYAFGDGTVIYEGDYNRKIRTALIQMLMSTPYHYHIVNHGNEDTSLRERVDIANNYHKRLKNCVYVCIHGNAGGGTGFEVYTSEGETDSDKVADVWIDEMLQLFPNQVDRGEKDRDFYVLRKTSHPAILTENFFMDKLEDCKLMLEPDFQKKVAQAHFNMIDTIEKNGI